MLSNTEEHNLLGRQCHVQLQSVRICVRLILLSVLERVIANTDCSEISESMGPGLSLPCQWSAKLPRRYDSAY